MVGDTPGVEIAQLSIPEESDVVLAAPSQHIPRPVLVGIGFTRTGRLQMMATLEEGVGALVVGVCVGARLVVGINVGDLVVGEYVVPFTLGA